MELGVGWVVGADVGFVVGSALGDDVLACVGLVVGSIVGFGEFDGWFVGAEVGWVVGVFWFCELLFVEIAAKVVTVSPRASIASRIGAILVAFLVLMGLIYLSKVNRVLRLNKHYLVSVFQNYYTTQIHQTTPHPLQKTAKQHPKPTQQPNQTHENHPKFSIQPYISDNSK
jgi:hypothetical protein